MRELLVASCLGEKFEVGEKVIAYNFSEKNANIPIIKTYIKKYSKDETLEGDSLCKKIENDTYNIYNIGEYRIMGIIADFAKIAIWSRDDRCNRK